MSVGMEIEPMNEIFIINEIELKLTTTDFRCLSLILTAVSDLTLTTVCRMIHLRPGNWECNKLRAIGAGTWARDFFNSDIDHHFHFPVKVNYLALCERCIHVGMLHCGKDPYD